MKKASTKIAYSRKTFHKEIIVKPAKRLLKVLKGMQARRKSKEN